MVGVAVPRAQHHLHYRGVFEGSSYPGSPLVFSKVSREGRLFHLGLEHRQRGIMFAALSSKLFTNTARGCVVQAACALLCTHSAAHACCMHESTMHAHGHARLHSGAHMFVLLHVCMVHVCLHVVTVCVRLCLYGCASVWACGCVGARVHVRVRVWRLCASACSWWHPGVPAVWAECRPSSPLALFPGRGKGINHSARSSGIMMIMVWQVLSARRVYLRLATEPLGPHSEHTLRPPSVL